MPIVDERSRTAEIQRKIFRIKRLSAMPPVVWRLMEALLDENASIRTIESIIESDPALTSKVLSLANSAYYGVVQKITTISRAVVVIGFRELEVLAMGTGLAEIFDLKRAPEDFDGQGLWFHCMAAAWLGRELAEAARYPVPGEIMVAGLLHDLGKLVLATSLTEELMAVLDLVRQGTPFPEAEESLGVAHTKVGHWLALRWGLPEIHVAAIRDHHAPKSTDPYLVSTSLVFLADVIVKKLNVGLVQESRPASLARAMEDARLDVDRVREVAARAREQIPPMLEVWGRLIEKGPPT